MIEEHKPSAREYQRVFVDHRHRYLIRLLIFSFFFSICSGQSFSQNGSGYGQFSPPVNQVDQQSANLNQIQDWFRAYDAIRRQAQMRPNEKAIADQMLSKGLSLMVPGPEKDEAQKLLIVLVNRYQLACQQLRNLSLLPATEQLHRGYYQYFSDAGHLFSDYLAVQDNLFAVDQTTGQPLAGELMARKQNLEQLEQQVKFTDQQLRQRFGAPPYQY